MDGQTNKWTDRQLTEKWSEFGSLLMKGTQLVVGHVHVIFLNFVH